MKHSKRALERNARRKTVRIQEAAQAVVSLLEDWGCVKPGKTVQKMGLIAAVPNRIEQLRHSKRGGIEIPTIDNKVVEIASISFVKNNWSLIREECETYGCFIVWNMPGEPLGVRLGTAEEREIVQSYMYGALQGFTGSYNSTNRKLTSFGLHKHRLRIKEEE